MAAAAIDVVAWLRTFVGLIRYPLRIVPLSQLGMPAVCTALCLFGSGCDRVSGLYREAQIDVDPTPQCVERVLRSMPEIWTVTHLQRHVSGRPITLSGIQEPDVTETFSYEGPNHVWGYLGYTKDYKGRMSLRQYITKMGGAPPQEDVTATRPVMMHVEIALEAQCGLHNLAARIKEWCSGVQCPPIPKQGR
jgi:hypothetical protein